MRAACRASSTRTPLTPSAAAMNFQPESIPAKGSPSLLSSKRTSVTWLSQPDLKPFRRSHMPISERILRERQARYDRRIAEAKVNVPEGDYCYGNTGRMIATTLPGGAKATVPEAKPCPYWKSRGDKPEHANDSFRLMKAGDWMPHPPPDRKSGGEGKEGS